MRWSSQPSLRVRSEDSVRAARAFFNQTRLMNHQIIACHHLNALLRSHRHDLLIALPCVGLNILVEEQVFGSRTLQQGA